MKREHARTVRDLIEVVAIVLAGAWALYVFVYQNVILPGLADPTPTFLVTMRHVGNDGPFAVVRLEETVRNIGTVRVHFAGHSLTVLGMNVLPANAHATPPPPGEPLSTYTRFTKPGVVYRDAFVTQLGDRAQRQDLFLEPGQQFTISHEFYVPKNKYERLVAWLIATYTKYDSATIPTKLTIRPSGLPRFVWNSSALLQAAEPVAELDLRAE